MKKEQAEKIINGEDYKGSYKGFKYSVLRLLYSASPNSLIQSDLIVLRGCIEKGITSERSFYKKDCKGVNAVLDVDKECKSMIDQLINIKNNE